MTDQPTVPRRASTETGLVPRVDADAEPDQESSAPPDAAPPAHDPTSITGVITMYTEGEDAAKQADDSATRPEPPA